MRYVPDVRWHSVVPALELPHHRGITTVPVLQSGAARNLAVTTVVVKTDEGAADVGALSLSVTRG
jgi:hypothetical protein